MIMDTTVQFSFGEALTLLQAGMKVGREGWNGAGMWIALQIPDENSKMGLPYFYMKTSEKHGEKLVPWVSTHSDILATDWCLIKENN